jgi:glycerophosphoryl diester phosphodiesterase
MQAPKTSIRYVETFSRIQRNFGNCIVDLLVYDIFFKIVAVAILGPLAAWIFNRLVATSGALVIGNEHIVSFFLSPVGSVAFLLAGGVALTMVFAEQAGLIIIASQSEAGRRITFFQTAWHVTKALSRLLELAVRQVIISVLCLAPLAGIGFISFMVLTADHDINYLLATKPPSFWAGAAVLAVLALGGVLIIATLYIRWIFSVPICMLTGHKPPAAMQKSRDLVSGNFRQIAVIIGGWALLTLAAAGATTLLLDVFSANFLKHIGENPATVIGAVCVVLALYAFTAVVLTFIGFAINCLLITRLYIDISRQQGSERMPPPAKDLESKIVQPSQRKSVWGIAVLTMVITMISSYFIVDDIDFDHQVAVTAHRGSSKLAPENTLSAVRRAIEDGAHFAEIDVQETADGVIVLLHDTDLMRIAGLNKNIWQVTYSEIKSLDVGSWFSKDFSGEHIPTLAETIELARDKIKLNIELKFNGHEKQLVANVAKIIEDHQFESRCVISSLNFAGLQKVRELNPDLQTGFIVARSIGNMVGADIDFLSLAASMVTADVVAAAAKRKKEVHVWTINSPARMSYFIDLGVDNIITDYPARLVALIKERESYSDIEKLLLATANMLKR